MTDAESILKNGPRLLRFTSGGMVPDACGRFIRLGDYTEVVQHMQKAVETMGAAMLKAEAALAGSEARHSGWISVDERLPEAYGDYLVVLGKEVGCAHFCSQVWGPPWTVSGDYGYGVDLEGIVTHWMPLPPPPKESA